MCLHTFRRLAPSDPWPQSTTMKSAKNCCFVMMKSTKWFTHSCLKSGATDSCTLLPLSKWRYQSFASFYHCKKDGIYHLHAITTAKWRYQSFARHYHCHNDGTLSSFSTVLFKTWITQQGMHVKNWGLKFLLRNMLTFCFLWFIYFQ